MTFFTPNDHFFFFCFLCFLFFSFFFVFFFLPAPTPSAPRPFSPFLSDSNQNSSLSPPSPLVPSDLSLSSSEWAFRRHSDDCQKSAVSCHYPQCTALTRLLKFLWPDSPMLVDSVFCHWRPKSNPNTLINTSKHQYALGRDTDLISSQHPNRWRTWLRMHK